MKYVTPYESGKIKLELKKGNEQFLGKTPAGKGHESNGIAGPDGSPSKFVRLGNFGV